LYQPQEKSTTRTHEGKTFVPLAYKNRPY